MRINPDKSKLSQYDISEELIYQILKEAYEADPQTWYVIGELQRRGDRLYNIDNKLSFGIQSIAINKHKIEYKVVEGRFLKKDLGHLLVPHAKLLIGIMCQIPMYTKILESRNTDKSSVYH